VALSPLYLVKAGAAIAIVAIVAAIERKRHHPFDRFGPANQITAVRAVLVSLTVALVGEPHSNSLAAAAAALGLLVMFLDGLDGWVARRTAMVSEFGARFDMEVDALLILALSMLAWRYGKAGAWVLLSGLLRYLFVVSGWLWSWLRAPLPSSLRGKVICVMQIVGLAATVSPLVPRPASAVIAAASLGALAYSFVVDVVWLWQRSDR
jgi:phosphatidylglycerophosphate synthase